MRVACVWRLQVGLRRLGYYVLARFGDVQTRDAAFLAREAGTSFFVNAAAASSSAQLAGNEPLPDTVGELLFLEFMIFLESQAHIHLRRGTEGKGEGNWKQLNATVSVAS